MALPRHEQIFRALCAYDLIGFQTANDLAAFHDYIVLEADGEVLDNGLVRAFERTLRTGVFAIGIDTEEIEALAEEADRAGERAPSDDHAPGPFDDRRRGPARLQQGPCRALPRLRAHAGGLPQKTRRGHLYADRPALAVRCRRAMAISAGRWRPPSGNINGRFADFDWVPIRYLNKSFDRPQLACFLPRGPDRRGHAALRDGMNLVAKEYVAAQRAEDPGVLVLSRFAGAAHELDGALIVNPYDLDEVAKRLAPGARDAARRAPRTASADAEPAASTQCPSLAQGVSRGVRQPPARAGRGEPSEGGRHAGARTGPYPYRRYRRHQRPLRPGRGRGRARPGASVVLRRVPPARRRPSPPISNGSRPRSSRMAAVIAVRRAGRWRPGPHDQPSLDVLGRRDPRRAGVGEPRGRQTISPRWR